MSNGRIDFIWLGSKAGVSSVGQSRKQDNKRDVWKVDCYAVMPIVFEDGVYDSDHRCVVGDSRLYPG